MTMKNLSRNIKWRIGNENLISDMYNRLEIKRNDVSIRCIEKLKRYKERLDQDRRSISKNLEILAKIKKNKNQSSRLKKMT